MERKVPEGSGIQLSHKWRRIGIIVGAVALGAVALLIGAAIIAPSLLAAYTGYAFAAGTISALSATITAVTGAIGAGIGGLLGGSIGNNADIKEASSHHKEKAKEYNSREIAKQHSVSVSRKPEAPVERKGGVDWRSAVTRERPSEKGM